MFDLASLQTFFSSSFASCSACTFKSESVFSILNKLRFLSLSFVLRCCNNFLYRLNAANLISCVSFFNIVKFYTPKIMTPIQPIKSKSLFELINLIQIKESVVVILPIFSVVLTYFIFSYAFDIFSSRENQGYYNRSSMSPRVVDSKLICDVLLSHYITHIGGRSYSSKTDNLWASAQTKLSSIYRHKRIVIYCALMKHQALLTIQAKLKPAISNGNRTEWSTI